jgi:hypothetical protein
MKCFPQNTEKINKYFSKYNKKSVANKKKQVTGGLKSCNLLF